MNTTKLAICTLVGTVYILLVEYGILGIIVAHLSGLSKQSDAA